MRVELVSGDTRFPTDLTEADLATLQESRNLLVKDITHRVTDSVKTEHRLYRRYDLGNIALATVLFTCGDLARSLAFRKLGNIIRNNQRGTWTLDLVIEQHNPSTNEVFILGQPQFDTTNYPVRKASYGR